MAGTIVGNWKMVREKGAEEKIIGEVEEWRETEDDRYNMFYPGITPWRRQPGNWEKFQFLCGKRLKEGGLGWLLGLTVCAPAGFCLLAVYLGFAFSWTITWYTIELGLMGLLYFFRFCFPQMILYLPAWAILTWQGLEGKARLRLFPALFAAVFLSVGAGLEAFANPWFL